jgi:hypothetical protein
MQEPFVITREDIDRIVKESMQKGALAAREALGIPTDPREAAEFIQGLREASAFMRAWRETKKLARKTLVETVVRWGTIALLTGMVAYLGWDKFVGK